ncbi:MAG TPA: S1/P1 nuclease [Xanthobacteraceae bacterium]|nr:S1/P1 nuclease [Xanthobacteraceae bacterium]
MRTIFIAAVLALAPLHQASAWGQEGHSIVAEIAQRRLSPAAADAVNRLLEKASMASIASWADDVRTSRRKTNNWHFADIPIAQDKFDRARDCKPDPDQGDCIVAELERLRNDLRCAPTDEAKREALQFAVHFLGDIHQPLHTVDEQGGGNGIDVLIFVRGRTSDKGKLALESSNLHTVWDELLISRLEWAWGSYVARLEREWLKSSDATKPDIDGGTPTAWVEETHKKAQEIWAMTPSHHILDDDYLAKAKSILDRQLGVAGLRLARFLNEAYGSNQCPVP